MIFYLAFVKCYEEVQIVWSGETKKRQTCRSRRVKNDARIATEKRRVNFKIRRLYSRDYLPKFGLPTCPNAPPQSKEVAMSTVEQLLFFLLKFIRSY